MSSLGKIKWIWFDLDNTLVDFSQASKLSFRDCFLSHSLPYSAASYEIYSQVNSSCWQALEAGDMTALELRAARFDRSFEQLGIQGIDGLEFNAAYMTKIIKHTKAYPGVRDMLLSLKTRYRLAIITNGLAEAQRPRLRATDLYQIFDTITVSDEIGYSKPHKAFFSHSYALVNNPDLDPSEILVEGDSLASDILGGQRFGCQTCWISHGRALDDQIGADYHIHSVLDLPDLLHF